MPVVVATFVGPDAGVSAGSDTAGGAVGCGAGCCCCCSCSI